MSKNIAFIFPGQGSQVVGMLSGLAADYPVIQETFAEASEALHFDLWQLSQEGPAECLNQTQLTQPTLLTASVAMWRLWKQAGGRLPSFMAGHSVGEYSALVCAGSIDFLTAVQVVSERGRFMQEAVPEGAGAMAAIVGLESAQLQALCDSLNDGQVLSPANYNSIEQIVVAGNSEAVDKLVERAKQIGAKLAKRIPVSVPSHCALMKPAAKRLAQYLDGISFLPLKCPVINNVDVCIEKESNAIKDALVRQLFNPVRWVEIVQWLQQRHIEFFVECGPGKVLASLNKRITTIPTLSIHDSDTLRRSLIA